MELSNLSGANLYTERAMLDQTSANVEKLRRTARQTAEAETDEELMGACREFEAYFMEQMYKEMLKTVDVFSKDRTNDQSTSSLVDFFKSNTLQEFCKTTSETQSLGLAQMLYDSMKRSAGVSADSIPAAEESGDISG